MRATELFLVFASVVLLYGAYGVRAKGGTRLFVAAKKIEDSVEKDPSMEDVYRGVLRLLVHKMKTWLKSDPSSKAEDERISRYLGFPDETVGLIDDAFTELIYRHVAKRTVRIDNLGAAYLYSCDIEHMYDPGVNWVNNIQVNFEMILTNLGEKVEDNGGVRGEAELVDDLRRSLEAIERPVDRWYRASIALVKSRVFTERSANKTMDGLKRRFIREYNRKLAETFESETEVLRAVYNHVGIARKIVPDLFGFAYDHVVLLTALRKFDVRDLDDNSPVTRCSDVLALVAAIFVNRHFEFLNTEDYLLFKRDIFRFLDFFDPRSEYAAREVSIAEYKTDGKDFDERVWRATNTGIEKMLTVFSDEMADEWAKNRTVKIDYGGGGDATTVDRARILELMEKNVGEAKGFLAELKRRFGFDGDGENGDGEYAQWRRSITVALGSEEKREQR